MKVSNSFLDRNFNWIAFALVSLLIIIAYSNTLHNSFHFDDDPAITENAMIKHVTGDNIKAILSGARPVVYLSLMFNYALGQLNPVGWHMFNIGVHIVNTIFVYLFILWTLELPALRWRWAGKAKWMALCGALLFGLHPIQTEAVTYIITRSELLATCFYLLTFLLLIRGAKSGKFFYALGILITSLLAVGSKEWAVTLPALLILYDFLFLAEGKVKAVASRWYVYLFAALSWWIVLSRLNLFSTAGGTSVGFNVVTVTGITPTSYFYTSLNVIWTYFRLLFLPIKQNIDYDYPIAKTLLELPTILSLLGHLAIVAAAFWLYKTRKWTLIPFGVAWFYIGLSPVQSVVPVIDVIFEHRLYMPSIGFFLAVVAGYSMIFDLVSGEEPQDEKAVKPAPVPAHRPRKKRLSRASA